MARPDASINVIAMIGHADADLLPFYLDHYRRMGVSGFVLAFHGDWDPAVLDRLDEEADVHIWDLLKEPYSEDLRLNVLNRMTGSFRDRWILHADTDEFLELPCRSLKRTIQTLDVLGLDSLPALMMQRHAKDGGLPPLDPATDISTQFPCCNFGLCEEMGLEEPCWKTKFPLMRVTVDCQIRPGNHVPPHSRSTDHAPLRGVVHHFKWRASLNVAMNLPRCGNANSHEMETYRTWLNDHDGRLPIDGAQAYSRNDLIARGFLVPPTRHTLRLGSLYRKIRTVRDVGRSEQHRLTHQLAGIGQTRGKLSRTDRERALADPLNLLQKPGRVCLLTFELAPPQTGGIATAMTVLAERLSAIGHEVDVLFCPFYGPEALWEGWHDYWAARNVTLHYLPRKIGSDGAYRGQIEFCQAISATLERLDPDLIHCADAAGYGALIALAKAAGLAFPRTKLMVTAHGSTAWHNRGNQVRWYADEPEHSFCYDVMMSLVDTVCYPSHYMQAVVSKAGLGIETCHVIPNGLPGVTRSYHIGQCSEIRPVDELVLFSRIEPRKGFARFERAIQTLLHRGYRNFKVTLLGRLGDLIDPGIMNALLGEERITTQHIANFNHVDAVNYLKSRNCLAVVASLRDNLPYTVYECLENGIPLIVSSVGGIPELVHPDDRAHCLVADNQDALVDALSKALTEGARSSRLAFDPSIAELDLLAIHAKLVDEARQDRAKGVGSGVDERNHESADIAAIVYGDLPAKTTPCLIETLADAAANQQIGTLHVLDGLCNAGLAIEMLPNESKVGAVNRAVLALDSKLLLFSHASVVPDPAVIVAMQRLIGAAEFEGVVSWYRAGLNDGDGQLTNPLPAPGGPVVLAPCHNLFGAGLFLITREAFERLGGFSEDGGLHGLSHWVLLNRLVATGGRVVGLPKALATVWLDHPKALSALMDDMLAETLTRPWVEAAAPHLEDLVRKAIAADFGTCPTMRTIQEDLVRHGEKGHEL